jgi:fatty acid desaturase
MFLTNHGSDTDSEGQCIPSSSTYAGKWYELLTLNTVFHVEHHDFPTIPFQKLGELRKIAPEFYPGSLENNDDIFSIMNDVFEDPDFYACMDAGLMQKER